MPRRSRWLSLGLLLLLVVLAVLALRPSALLLEWNGDVLSASVNRATPSSDADERCKHELGGGWYCAVDDSNGDPSAGYIVKYPDFWGCWSARLAVSRNVESDLPATLDGCITLLDHS